MKVIEVVNQLKSSITPLRTKLTALYKEQNNLIDSAVNAGLEPIKEKYGLNTLVDQGITLSMYAGLTLEAKGVRLMLDYESWRSNNKDEFEDCNVRLDISTTGYGWRNGKTHTSDTLVRDFDEYIESFSKTILILNWAKTYNYIDIARDLFNNYTAVYKQYEEFNQTELQETRDAIQNMIDVFTEEVFSSISTGDDLSEIVSSKVIEIGRRNTISSTPYFDKYTVGRGVKGFRVIHKFEDASNNKTESYKPDEVKNHIKYLLSNTNV